MHIRDVLGPDQRCSHGPPDDLLLRLAVRRRQPVALAVVVHRRAGEETQDAVAALARVVELAQEKKGAAFAAHDPVRVRVERAALARLAEHADLRRGRPRRRCQVDLDAADEHRVALAVADGRCGQVQRDARGRARRVDDRRRAADAEMMRNASGNDAAARARAVVRADARAAAVQSQQLQIVVKVCADHDAHVRSGERRGIDAGVFQCVPRRLERQSLLRVHVGRLVGRQVEKVCIEPGDVVEKGALARTDRVWEERVCVPALFGHGRVCAL